MKVTDIVVTVSRQRESIPIFGLSRIEITYQSPWIILIKGYLLSQTMYFTHGFKQFHYYDVYEQLKSL